MSFLSKHHLSYRARCKGDKASSSPDSVGLGSVPQEVSWKACHPHLHPRIPSNWPQLCPSAEWGSLRCTFANASITGLITTCPPKPAPTSLPFFSFRFEGGPGKFAKILLPNAVNLFAAWMDVAQSALLSQDVAGNRIYPAEE
ncbi:hypothetical protein NPIL_544231 [Nephila pilipes]|uniref:Uncharacterized protein n=1 Tax=Nephila pilipes TaxID=299642 RepID=A0A8X6PNW9_NEPPI|nr:hypothetical protein NPIL_544231 [Nephila pilipes]